MPFTDKNKLDLGSTNDITIESNETDSIFEYDNQNAGNSLKFKKNDSDVFLLDNSGKANHINDIILQQTSNDYTITWNDPSSPRTLTIPDPGGNDTFLFEGRTLTGGTGISSIGDMSTDRTISLDTSASVTLTADAARNFNGAQGGIQLTNSNRTPGAGIFNALRLAQYNASSSQLRFAPYSTNDDSFDLNNDMAYDFDNKLWKYSGDVSIGSDNSNLFFGSGDDISISFDGTDALFEYDAQNAGTTSLKVQQNGSTQVQVDANGDFITTNRIHEQGSDAVNAETLNGNKALATSDALNQLLDPNGSNRDITLPAEANSKGLEFFIKNTADGSGENLVIKSDAPATLLTLEPEDEITFMCDGSTWHQIGNVKGKFHIVFGGDFTGSDSSLEYMIVNGNARSTPAGNTSIKALTAYILPSPVIITKVKVRHQGDLSTNNSSLDFNIDGDSFPSFTLDNDGTSGYSFNLYEQADNKIDLFLTDSGTAEGETIAILECIRI